MKNYSSKPSKRGKTAYRTPSPFIGRKIQLRKNYLLRKPGGK